MLCGSFSFAWMGTATYALGRTEADWRVTALARSALAFAFAAGLAGAAGARLVLWRPRILWVRSIAGSVSLVCTFYALNKLPQSHVLTLTSTFPVWVALLSWPLYRERPSAAVWLSVLCSVGGVALLQWGRPVAVTHANPTEAHWGVAAALVASVATAVAMLGLHRLQDIDTRAIVVHFSGVASLFCLGSCFVLQPAPAWAGVANPRDLLLLLAIGLTATVGQLFLTKAFAAGPPARVSVVGLSQVLFALVLDLVLWHQPFRPATYVGIALVVAPTAWMMAAQGGEPAHG
jgi:drug/metabolite transporter (DMT)-like permease